MITFFRTEAQSVPVKFLVAEMKVRYWEDASVNGVEETEEETQIPFKKNNMWTLKIELETGKILNWPANTTAKTHYKICDAGTYSLLDENDNIVAEIKDYVPSILYPNAKGYGDYVILDINETGHINHWNPNLSAFEDRD